MLVIDEIRKRKNLSQLGLARKSGLPQPTVWLILNGLTRRPKLYTMLKLAKALGIDPGLLLVEVETLSPEEKKELGL